MEGVIKLNFLNFTVRFDRILWIFCIALQLKHAIYLWLVLDFITGFLTACSFLCMIELVFKLYTKTILLINQLHMNLL